MEVGFILTVVVSSVRVSVSGVDELGERFRGRCRGGFRGGLGGRHGSGVGGHQENGEDKLESILFLIKGQFVHILYFTLQKMDCCVLTRALNILTGRLQRLSNYVQWAKHKHLYRKNNPLFFEQETQTRPECYATLSLSKTHCDRFVVNHISWNTVDLNTQMYSFD